MNVTPTAIPEVSLVRPKLFSGDRGFFFESFSQKAFEEANARPVNFVQDSDSRISKNVLRGLHQQVKSLPGKLVRATSGEVFDVAVDVHISAPSFGQWVGAVLSADSKTQLWVLESFSHSFAVLSESEDFFCKTTDFYAAEHVRAIIRNDTQFPISWPEGTPPVLSGKDQQASTLEQAEVFV
jgi:dTDP-4-dehydrorhamnose 3,5-epimerase